MIELIPIKDRKGKCCICGSEFVKYRIIDRITIRDVCNVCALTYRYISEDLNFTNDTDYIYEEANRIKDGKEPLDRNRLHQYLLDESKSDKRAAKSYLKVLMLHLLKCIYQSDKTSRSWHQSIVNSYNDFYDCVEDSRLVLSYIKDNFDVIYNQTRTNAYYETGLPLNTFPKDNIFNLTDLLNEDWILEFLKEHPVAKW